MKKLFVIMFVALATVATAQQRGGFQNMTAEERAKTMTDRLAELVTLTADQKTKISAIELDLAKQLETNRRNAQGDQQGMRTAMQEIERVREEKYKPVLTADQFKKYVDDRDQRQRERGQGGGGGARRPGN